MTKLSKTALAALMIAMTPPAFASEREGRLANEREGAARHDRDHDRDEIKGPVPAGWLSREEIASRLATAGLKADRIKVEHNRYEAYATASSGARVKVYIDPVSGEIANHKKGGRN